MVEHTKEFSKTQTGGQLAPIIEGVEVDERGLPAQPGFFLGGAFVFLFLSGKQTGSGHPNEPSGNCSCVHRFVELRFRSWAEACFLGGNR